MATIIITLKDTEEPDGTKSVVASFIGNERFRGEVTAENLTPAELMFFALFSLIEFSSRTSAEEALIAVEAISSMDEEDDLEDILEDLRESLDANGFFDLLDNTFEDLKEEPKKDNVIRLVVNNDDKEK